jgi:hypothetical protein
MIPLVESFQKRYGDGAALVAEIWINAFIYGDKHNVNHTHAYANLIKSQIKALTRYFNVSPSVFKIIVEESRSYVIRHGQTLH